MPLIQVKLKKELFTPTHKKEIVSKLTNAVVPIRGREHASCHLGQHRRGLQW